MIMRAEDVRFGHELLTIIIRYALILVSTLDPDSAVAERHASVFRISPRVTLVTRSSSAQ